MSTATIVGAPARTATPALLQRIAGAYEWLAARQALACATLFALTLAIRLALLPWLHVPEPAIHDEFSYLLAGDTYASGRLANPPHRFWEHFETFHVLQQPTYASKYQPMQGLVLAVGEKLFGDPWVGVLLSTALMCASVCWMLQGWTSSNLAFLGGLLVMLRVGLLGYWMNSYWGGAVPAIGGALLFGAIPRIAKRGRHWHSVTFALGLVVLLNSRPYEGIVFGLAGALVLAWWLWKTTASSWSRLGIVVLPVLAILGLAAGAMAYNNYRVTGDALMLPYQVHERQYAVGSMFAWSAPRPEPVYHHAVMREFWASWHVQQVQAARKDLLEAFLIKVSNLYEFFFGLWPLLIPALIWPYPLKTTEERLTAVLLGVFLVSIAPLTGIEPHYAAAIMGVLYLRFLQSLDRLSGWRPAGKPIGLALCALLVALIPYLFGREIVRVFHGEYQPRLTLERGAIARELEKHPGRHLVLVRYSPHHNVLKEWVYNRADIDASRIVWAREMGPQQDRPLIDYFHDRQVWLVEPDESPARLAPYGVTQ